MGIKELLHESNLIEGFNSKKADIAAEKAWEYLIHHLTEMTTLKIQQTQARVVSHQKLPGFYVGVYRSRGRLEATVGGQPVMKPAHVDRAMEAWLERYNTDAASPKELHIEFEKIHPFGDGNGRVGRMLLWLKERRVGLPFTQITKADVQSYYDWFK